jgi:hypothetical protein
VEAEPLMPRVVPRKQKFKDGDVVLAWQAFVIDVDGTPYTFRTGARLRGDHPVVKAAPCASCWAGRSTAKCRPFSTI